MIPISTCIENHAVYNASPLLRPNVESMVGRISIRHSNPSMRSGVRINSDLQMYLAGVVKLVDTMDSKSIAGDSVAVQVRPPVPIT